MIFQILEQISRQGLTTPIFTAIVGLLIALIFGLTVHEFAHAAAATWLGDTLPRQQGRVTLEPAAHLDPMGSLMFLLAGFGWGKPVQFNPFALRMNPRQGSALIALAGPVSNIILATLVAVVVRILPILFGKSMWEIGLSSGPDAILIDLLTYIVFFNLVLAVFNLIPIPPLDGFSVLMGVLPAEMADWLRPFEQWGMFLLLGLMLMDRYSGILGAITDGPILFLYQLLIRVGS